MLVQSPKFGALIFKPVDNCPQNLIELASTLNSAIRDRRGFYQHKNEKWLMQLQTGSVPTFPPCDLVATLEPNTTQDGRADLRLHLIERDTNRTPVADDKLRKILITLPNTFNPNTPLINPLNYFLNIIQKRLRHRQLKGLLNPNKQPEAQKASSTSSTLSSRPSPKIETRPLFEKVSRRRRKGRAE